MVNDRIAVICLSAGGIALFGGGLGGLMVMLVTAWRRRPQLFNVISLAIGMLLLVGTLVYVSHRRHVAIGSPFPLDAPEIGAKY